MKQIIREVLHWALLVLIFIPAIFVLMAWDIMDRLDAWACGSNP